LEDIGAVVKHDTQLIEEGLAGEDREEHLMRRWRVFLGQLGDLA
jgi:hypothetical protein